MLKITAEQEYWGIMITLLSMDVVSPFYSYMGLDISEPEAFKALLRADILANREDFLAEPDRVPDLRKRNLDSLMRVYGEVAARGLEQWFKTNFVWQPRDFGDYSQWNEFLGSLRWYPEKWQKLALPDNILLESRDKYIKDLTDKSELHTISDKLDEQIHTKWDIEMYALHGFDDYDNDPYHAVLFIIRYRKLKLYLKWLISSLDKSQLTQFLQSANQIKETIPDLKSLKQLISPEDIR